MFSSTNLVTRRLIQHLLMCTAFAIPWNAHLASASAFKECAGRPAAQQALSRQMYALGFQFNTAYCPPAPEDSRCLKDPSDNFDPAVLIRFGKEKGECADTHEVRVPRILHYDGDYIVVSNMLHARRWWIAKIPRNGIEKVYAITGVFKGFIETLIGAAHVQFRIRMKPGRPVELVSQATAEHYDTTELQDFFISSDPFQPQKTGSDGTNGIATRLVSATDRVFDHLALKNGYDRYIQHELIFNDLQSLHFVESAIAHSVQQDYNEVYDLRKNNCATKAIDLVDIAFPPSRPLPRLTIATSDLLTLNAVIGPTRRALSARGVLSKHSTLMDYETDGGRSSIQTMVDSVDEKDKQEIIDLINTHRR